MKHIARTVALALALTTAASTAVAEPHDARVRAFIVNPEGQLEGLLLSDQASVRFGEMVGRDVEGRVRVGDRVMVSADGMTLEVPRTRSSFDLGLISLGRGGGPATPIPVARRERALDGMTVSGGPTPGTQRFDVRGQIAGLTRTRAHWVDGFVIRGGITVHVAPSQAARLEALRPGDTVTVRGEGTRGARGIGLEASEVRGPRGQLLFTAR